MQKLLIWYGETGMTMFYCQCHDFKVGQDLELTRWWMDSGMGNVNVFSSVDITGCIILKRFFLEAFCNQTIGQIYILLWFLYNQLHNILISMLAFNENIQKNTIWSKFQKKKKNWSWPYFFFGIFKNCFSSKKRFSYRSPIEKPYQYEAPCISQNTPTLITLLYR